MAGELIAAAVPPQTVTTLDDQNVLVIAEQPGELQVAQAALVEWANRKLQSLKAELVAAQKSLDEALIHKWRLTPFQKVVRDLEAGVMYYKKVMAALAEGYCIVPNFPVQVFAIRTTQDAPDDVLRDSRYAKPRMTQAAEVLEEGEGRYVSPDPVVRRVETEYETNTQGTRQLKTYWWQAGEFKDVALPVKFMKPRVLQATQRAMALSVFDDLALVDGPRGKKSDPLVVGRIYGPKGRMLTLMVAWFIDSRDL